MAECKTTSLQGARAIVARGIRQLAALRSAAVMGENAIVNAACNIAMAHNAVQTIGVDCVRDSNNNVIASCDNPHKLRAGQRVYIGYAHPPDLTELKRFLGTYFVESVLSPTAFTFQQFGPNEASTQRMDLNIPNPTTILANAPASITAGAAFLGSDPLANELPDYDSLRDYATDAPKCPVALNVIDRKDCFSRSSAVTRLHLARQHFRFGVQNYWWRIMDNWKKSPYWNVIRAALGYYQNLKRIGIHAAILAELAGFSETEVGSIAQAASGQESWCGYAQFTSMAAQITLSGYVPTLAGADTGSDLDVHSTAVKNIVLAIQTIDEKLRGVRTAIVASQSGAHEHSPEEVEGFNLSDCLVASSTSSGSAGGGSSGASSSASGGNKCFMEFMAIWDCVNQKFLPNDDPVQQGLRCLPADTSTAWKNVHTSPDRCIYQIFVPLDTNCDPAGNVDAQCDPHTATPLPDLPDHGDCCGSSSSSGSIESDCVEIPTSWDIVCDPDGNFIVTPLDKVKVVKCPPAP